MKSRGPQIKAEWVTSYHCARSVAGNRKTTTRHRIIMCSDRYPAVYPSSTLAADLRSSRSGGASLLPSSLSCWFWPSRTLSLPSVTLVSPYSQVTLNSESLLSSAWSPPLAKSPGLLTRQRVHSNIGPISFIPRLSEITLYRCRLPSGISKSLSCILSLSLFLVVFMRHVVLS